MKKIFRFLQYSAVIAALGMSSVSCDDFLTTDPADQVPSTVALSSTAELNMVLTSAYKQLLFNNANDNGDRIFAGIPGMEMWYDLRGTDIMSHTNMGGYQVSSYQFAPDLTRANGDANVVWSFAYKLINLCNTIIDSSEGATGSAEEKNLIVAQAKAMRGIAYFTLIINYQQTYMIAKNKRGVILRLSKDDPDEMGFSTVEEVYTQILKDLKDAETGLSSFERNYIWQINNDVVYGWLARVYQVMNKWDECYEYANKLYNKYSTLMTKEQWYSGFDDHITNGYPEVIWAMSYTDENNLGGGTQVNFWYNQDPETFGEGQTGIYRFFNFFTTPEYVALFDENDWRGIKVPYEKEHVSEAEELAAMFWRRTENANQDVNTKWVYNKWKHYGDASNNTRSEVTLMRGSEMLLVAAEAAANKDNTGEALTLLNTLQSSRNANLTPTSSKNDLLEAIYVERRKELLGEGVTGQYDLVRLQKPLVRYEATDADPANHWYWGVQYLNGYDTGAAQHSGRIDSNDYRFFFQIPEDEFTYNSAISQADQNPFEGK